MPDLPLAVKREVLPRCQWCFKHNQTASEREQRNMKGAWHRLCVRCANRRLGNPWNALLPMRKVGSEEKERAAMSDETDVISEAVAGFASPKIRAEARAILEREQRRSLLAAHGYDPDLPARGVTGPPSEVTDGWGRRDGAIVRVKLRNHVCELEGVEIDGHADPDRSGACIYCSADLS